MWSKRSKIKKNSGHYDTLISDKTKFKGNILFSGGLHVDGQVVGNIRAEENDEAIVRISDVGEVRGDVHAPHVIVNGTVHGDVYATKHIELASAASIHGNVYYNLIEMEMGAEVNGQLVHQVEEKNATMPAKAETAPAKAAVAGNVAAAKTKDNSSPPPAKASAPLKPQEKVASAAS